MNYYDVLGVARDASDKEIKDAFNNMIKAFHPDMYRGSDKEFASKKTRELYEAFEVLRDPDKRKAYDSYIGNNNSYNWQEDHSNENNYSTSSTSGKTTDTNSESEEEKTSTNGKSDNTESEGNTKEKEPTETHYESEKQQSELPVKKGTVFKVLIAFSILIVVGAYVFSTFLNKSPYAGTYEYYKLEIRDSEDNLVDAQDAYSSDVYHSITLNNDGTATSVLKEDYAEGTWNLDRTEGDYAVINLYFTGDSSAATISYLTLFNNNNSAIYGFEDEGLNYLFYYVKK